jgi:hypothetical protein
VVSSLLESEGVLGADAGKHRDFLATQSVDATALAVRQADIAGLEQFPAGPQETGQPTGCFHRSRLGALGLPPVKTIEQGAATSVLLAASPDVEGVTGRYYEDCAEATLVSERGTHTGGVAPYALDQNNADRLWHVSNDLTQ